MAALRAAGPGKPGPYDKSAHRDKSTRPLLMDQALAIAVSILFLGSAYAMILYIISVGLSVTMGLMGFQNLAHGVFAMAGGYVATRAMADLGVPFVPSLVLAFVAVALISVAFERLLYARLYGASELEQVLFTIGLAFMAIAAARFLFGPLSQRVDLPDYLKGQIDLWGRGFPTYRVFLIVVGAAIIATLWLTIERTNFGAQVRAAVDNQRMARGLGIDVDRVFAITFALGSGLAGLGGALAVEIVGLDHAFAFTYLVYVLIVVAVGGLGSIAGSFVAATLLGISDMAGKYYFPELGAFLIYFVMVTLLMWRPAGLFGRR
jgi:branched-chain amino acid transport system permease protein